MSECWELKGSRHVNVSHRLLFHNTALTLLRPSQVVAVETGMARCNKGNNSFK